MCYIFISLLKPDKAIFSLTNQKNDLVILASFIRPPGEVYGSEIRFLRTVKTLRKLNTEIIPITNGRLVSKITNLVQDRYVVPLHLPRNLSKTLLNYYYVMKTIISILIKPPKFDLTLSLDGNLMDMLASFLISYLLRKPFVVLVHHAKEWESTTWKDYPKTVRRRGLKAATVLTVGRIIRRFIARRSTLIMAVSQASRNEYSRYWGIPSSHIFVTGNGPNIMVQNLIPMKERKIDVLYIGRFSPSKGIDLLPLICEQLIQKYSNLRMVAVGGSNKDLVSIQKKVAELGLERNLEIKGYLPDSELEKIVEDSKIFIMPSYYEGFSIATLEAMCAGCVCVISDIESLRRLYSGISLFAKVGDASDFAQVISSLLDSPNEMERMSMRSKEFSKLFDWDRIIQRELSVYKNIVYKNKSFIRK